MRLRLSTLVAPPLLGALALVSVAAASDRRFIAPLNNEEEVQTPAVVSNGAGVATFSLNDEGDELDYRLIVANVDNILFSHIHCGPAGANGPVVVFLYGGPTTSNDGVLATGTITDADVIDRPDSAVCPGGVSDFDDVVEKIRSGGAYVNVHSMEYPGGEIRGQIR